LANLFPAETSQRKATRHEIVRAARGKPFWCRIGRWIAAITAAIAIHIPPDLIVVTIAPAYNHRFRLSNGEMPSDAFEAYGVRRFAKV
jgi:hypothetical protein